MKTLKLIMAVGLTSLFIIYGLEPFLKYVVFPFTLGIGVMFLISVATGLLVLREAVKQKKPWVFTSGENEQHY